jgi:hypothetical protein
MTFRLILILVIIQQPITVPSTTPVPSTTTVPPTTTVPSTTTVPPTTSGLSETFLHLFFGPLLFGHSLRAISDDDIYMNRLLVLTIHKSYIFEFNSLFTRFTVDDNSILDNLLDQSCSFSTWLHIRKSRNIFSRWLYPISTQQSNVNNSFSIWISITKALVWLCVNLVNICTIHLDICRTYLHSMY